MFAIEERPPAKFRYQMARSGRVPVGWYVREIQHPTGASGYISNNHADGRWRISADTRPPAQQPGYSTRGEAALAEWQMARDAKVALNSRISAWLKFGVELMPDQCRKWHWCETAGDDDPPDWRGISTGPFQSFADCEASVVSALGELPSHLRAS